MYEVICRVARMAEQLRLRWSVAQQERQLWIENERYRDYFTHTKVDTGRFQEVQNTIQLKIDVCCTLMRNQIAFNATHISYSRHRKVIVVWISIICKPFVFCNLHLNVHDYLIEVVASQHTCMSIRYLRTSTKEYAVAVMCLIEHTIY